MKTVAMRKAAKAKGNGNGNGLGGKLAAGVKAKSTSKKTTASKPKPKKKKKKISKKPKTLTLRDSSGKVIQTARKNGKVVYGSDADKALRSGFKNFDEGLKKGTIVKDQFGYKYTRPRKKTKGN